MVKILIRCITLILVTFVICIFMSCSKTVESENDILEVKMSTHRVGEKSIIYIYPSNVSISLYRAYIDCKSNELESDYRIANCNKQLLVKDDTVKISFTPKELVVNKKFHDIKIVIDDGKNIRIVDTSFIYTTLR